MRLALALLLFQDPMVAMVRNTAYARVGKAREMAADPALVAATSAKNAEAETREEIAGRDRDWIEGRSALRGALASSPCAERLRELIADDALIVEALLMDGQGALVCSSAPTSDYFQGDEAKWLQPVQEGKPVFVDEPALDESTATYAIQLSVPVMNEARTIGALTLTLRLSKGVKQGARPGSAAIWNADVSMATTTTRPLGWLEPLRSIPPNGCC